MFHVVRRFLSFLQRIADALERIAVALERPSAGAAAALPPESLSKEDAARFLGVDVSTIEQLIRTRKIAYVQHGAQRGRILPVEGLRRFLADNRQATGEELLDQRRREGPSVIAKGQVAAYLPPPKGR